MTHAHYRPYGWRAKIGLIVPLTNTVNEAEWARMAPEGVSIHVTRMTLHPGGDAAALDRNIAAAIASLTRRPGRDCLRLHRRLDGLAP